MITYAQARKVVGQETSYSELSGMKTSKAGAFCFFQADAGGRLIIDDRSLNDPCRTVLQKHIEPATAIEIHHVRGLTKSRFITPKDRSKGYMISTGEKSENVTLWVLPYNEWCLGLIYGGIRPGSFSNKEALARYDKLYATSAHDKLAARAALAKHGD